ncbi:pilus assembly FimT family protein [Pseudoalteromonas umbrosa]|uniref:pilus assembly FimT family protein n=1 Tax=Pseudoalteromonas umbrosa TaxID=3048489 RepID=UPI0024C3960C|nr:GspH/FimT family pseudopilin [Pseudoalteromonas sp. B95]MDK1287260.1 GspH/FimT family pseudopilin [Pseudoalteromonas sp. B95]
MRYQRGMSLLELLITVAILGVLASMTFFFTSSTYQENRAQSFLLELKRTVTFARAKATASDEIVIVCPVLETLLLENKDFACRTDWKSNRIVIFVDRDNNGSYTTDTDDLLRVMERVLDNDDLNYPVASLKFDSSGRLGDGQNGTFIYCPNGATTQNQSLNITQAGTALFTGDTTQTCT